MATIPIIVEPETDLQAGTLSIDEPSARVAQIDADILRRSLSGLTGQITGLFEDIKAVGDYQLKEVQVQLEINAEGGVSLIGSVKAGAKGAITLTFSR